MLVGVKVAGSGPDERAAVGIPFPASGAMYEGKFSVIELADYRRKSE
jgi:hypothetical protein